MIIRNYEDTDLEGCRSLWFDLNQRHREIYEAPKLGGDSPQLQFDEHLTLVGAAHIWLAVEGNELLGMVGYMPQEREVEPIVVADKHRGKGVGERLLKHVMEYAQEQGVWRITVRPVARNIEAIAFFHRAGFNTLGRIELAAHLRPPTSTWKSGAQLFDLPFDY